MGTIFKKIIDGEIPAHKIEEDQHFLAFLDINPLVKGHTLVVPKKETDYIFDITDDHFQELWLFAKKVAKKLKAKIDCKRIGIAVIGLEVAHAHIHLVPINNVQDINFAQAKLDLSAAELKEIAAHINT